MNIKDKGIKQALQQQPSMRLPSNFNYRTMQRLNEQIALQERRREKRIFTVWIITVTTILAGGLGYLGWTYFVHLSELYSQLKTCLPEKETFIYSLPILTALFLLALLNHWLQKKITQIKNGL